MKNIISKLLLVPFVAMAAAGCTNDEAIVFDHELPQFETNENAVLLEVILPSGSAAGDTYYILGDFNGGEDAIGDASWRLQKAAGNDSKWGIYLIPSTFVSGKTLADGFYFYSEAQREERSVRNEAVVHTLENAQTGNRYNVWVNRWAAYFDSGGGDEEEDGFAIYVQNKTGWDEIALYAWYDNAPVDAGWPGWLPSGTKTINGIELVYWKMAAYEGQSMNLIFNNNGNDLQVDGPQGFKIDRDLYITLKASEYTEFDIDNPYNGYVIYVNDKTSWPITNAYGWRTEVAGPVWPGWEAAGTKEVNGIEYIFFHPGEQYTGMTMNVLFNDGADKETNSVGIVLDQDRYFMATDDNGEGVLVEVDPNATGYTVYVENLAGWADVALHYWDDDKATDWPGLAPAGTEELGGVTYLCFELPAALDGKTINFILNNGGNGIQLANGSMEVTRNHYYRVPASGTGAPVEIVFRVYVDDQSGWAALALYGWGDYELAGWPGLQPAGTETINTVEYTYFDMPAGAMFKGVNLIFNNNGGGSQFDGPNVTVSRDFYYQITATAATEVTP